MKKNIVSCLLALFIILISPPLYGTHFISTRVAPVFDYPDVSAKRVDILVQNTQVELLDLDTGWAKILYGSKTGWTKKDWLSKSPINASRERTNIASIEVRKRASNFTSSAAAGRGLARENVRDRMNVAFSSYDFSSIVWLETNFAFEPDLLLDWWRDEFKEQ